MTVAMRRPQQASKHVRTLRQKHPTSLPLMLMHGHLLAAQVGNMPALRTTIDAGPIDFANHEASHLYNPRHVSQM